MGKKTEEQLRTDAERARAYRVANREAVNARAREKLARDRERINARRKARRAERHDDHLAVQRAWVEKNRDKVNATARKTWAKHRDQYVSKRRKKRADDPEFRSAQARQMKDWCDRHPNWREAYYARTRASSIERAKAWQKANPEKAKANVRKSFTKNREKYNARKRLDPVVKARNLERTKAWRKANPDKVKAIDAAKRAKRRSAPVVDRVAVRNHVMALKAAAVIACHWCGSDTLKGAERHIDHVIPLARGGVHSVENVVASCALCNTVKGARSIDRFRALLAERSA